MWYVDNLVAYQIYDQIQLADILVIKKIKTVTRFSDLFQYNRYNDIFTYCFGTKSMTKFVCLAFKVPQSN